MVRLHPILACVSSICSRQIAHHLAHSAVQRGSVAKPRVSFGSLGGGPAHKSNLEKAKEAATAAAAADAAPALRSRPPKSTLSSR